jgi:probable F420-dependent oxidoreductase
MPWSSPAARMKELIQAMHAIFDCWYDGKDLNFRGEFYKHTLMTPMFAPRNTQAGRPKIALAAVGPKMTEVAAAVADGLIIHPFTTERYLRDVTIPAVEAELARSGRSRKDFKFYLPHMTSSGATEESFNKVKKAIRNQLAFYGSTPAYKVVLDHHGWGDLQPELNIMSKQGRWDDMGELINDEILETFSVAGEPDQIAGKIKERFGDIIDRFSVTFADIPADKLPGIIAEIKAA